MSSDLPPSVPCSKCGCRKFKFPNGPQLDADMVVGICADCGRALTEADIRQHAQGLGLDSDRLPPQEGLKQVG